MRAGTVLATVALLVVAALAPAGVGAATVQAKPTVTGVEVGPTPAVVGESITVAPTIRNDATATQDFEIDAVALRTAAGERLREYTRAEGVGTVSPGGSVRVPFDLSFSDPGTKRFRVVVFGQSSDGTETRLEYPVTVEVRADHPDIRVDVDRTLTAGVTEGVNVTVSNGFEREIRGVTVEFDSADLDTSPTETGTPRIAAGEERTFDFTMQASGPRSDVVEITVRYRTTTGLARETTAVRTFEFEPLREDVALNADAPPRGETAVPVTVGNFGNAPLENVVLRAETTNGTVAPVAVGTVPAGTTRQVSMAVNGVESRAQVEITASYELGGETRRRSVESRVLPGTVPGEIELTGLDVEREDGRLHVVGSASNVGLEQVNSVVVRVASAPGVEPAPPSREYFVGTVPASDFVSFDVYATVEGDVSEIPLVVTYLADGERRTLRTSVPYDAPAQTTPSSGGGGSGLLVFGVGGLVALAVVALVVVGWRRRGE
jgi:hypothetical protein